MKLSIIIVFAIVVSTPVVYAGDGFPKCINEFCFYDALPEFGNTKCAKKEATFEGFNCTVNGSNVKNDVVPYIYKVELALTKRHTNNNQDKVYATELGVKVGDNVDKMISKYGSPHLKMSGEKAIQTINKLYPELTSTIKFDSVLFYKEPSESDLFFSFVLSLSDIITCIAIGVEE